MFLDFLDHLLRQVVARIIHGHHHASDGQLGTELFADLVERYLRGEFAKRASDVSPYLAALPYALDRWQAAPQLREWLAQGRLVLCNRYVPANMAHQGSKLEDEAERRGFFDWVDELEYGVLGLPHPDLHLLFEMPPAVAAQLAGERPAGPTGAEDIHEGDYVICRRRSIADDVQLVVAIVDEENATLKRFYKEKTRARLQPANDDYEPIYSDNCRIEAVVVGLVRKL